MQINATSRVNYDVITWGLIADRLSQDHKTIPELQRASIICDVADLARTGYVSQVTLMRVNSQFDTSWK